MRKENLFVSLLLAAVVALGVRAVASADGGMGAAAPAAKESGVMGEIWGRIDHIGADMKSIFVKDKKGQVHEVKVDDATKVSAGADAHAAPVASLKKGDRVRVKHQSGKASDIEVMVFGPTTHQLIHDQLAHPRRFAVVERLYAQGQRIMDDVSDGTVKPEEANKLIARLDAVRAEEKSDAAARSGHLDASAYAKLQGELNKVGSARHDLALGTRK